jgi:hypothetical protein
MFESGAISAYNDVSSMAEALLSGVYVPQAQVESEVLSGLRGVLDLCGAADVLDLTVEGCYLLARIRSKPMDASQICRSSLLTARVNFCGSVEEGLNDASWANTLLRALQTERESLVAASGKATGPPQLDAATAMDYRRQADKLFLGGGQAERKQLLRTLIGEVK